MQASEETNSWHSFEETIDSIVKLSNFFSWGVFSGERFTGKRLFDIPSGMSKGYQDGYLGSKPHVRMWTISFKQRHWALAQNMHLVTFCRYQGRRRRGGRGVLTPALVKIGSFDPPPPDSRMKWPKSGVFRFLGYFGVGWPPCRRFDPPTQKSVATPLVGTLHIPFHN